jgi:hypothetical protein
MRRARRRAGYTLLNGDPAGWVGHTAVLPDGRRVHAATAVGPVLLVERDGTPGYALHHTAAEDDTVALWQDVIRSATVVRTMTPAERARWARAVATVTHGEG